MISLSFSVCWNRISPGCAPGHNIRRYYDKSVQECKQLCIRTHGCVAIEYGVAHGGVRKHYNSRDCQLNTITNSEGCDGTYNNLDLYIMKKCPGKWIVNTSSVEEKCLRSKCTNHISIYYKCIQTDKYYMLHKKLIHWFHWFQNLLTLRESNFEDWKHIYRQESEETNLISFVFTSFCFI